MEDQKTYQHIIKKLTDGIPFGLFEEGKKCFFKDGEQVHYSDIWTAVKIMHNVQPGDPAKTLFELCPKTFEGIFPYKFTKHKFRKN